jgi:site-specific recombinase XerD
MTHPYKTSVSGPLKEFAEGFLLELAGLGYSPLTSETQLGLVRHLSEWLAAQGLTAGDLSEDLVKEFLRFRRQVTSRFRSPRALIPLLVYLRRLGVTPEVVPVVSSVPEEVLLDQFASYLVSQRGLGAATVCSYVSQVRPFVVMHLSGNGSWDLLTAGQVTTFITQRALRQRPRSTQVSANALRALLRWMWQEGMVMSPLDDAVGKFAAPADTPPPKALSHKEIGDLLAALPMAGSARLRNEAMLVLMWRLGLRAGEVASLRLDDIGWRVGVITVHGKRGRLDQIPLPVDVGKLLVAYLRRARPVGGAHREVFLGLDAPHRSITAAAVTSVAARALASAGISGPGAAHRLRHTAACAVLAGGGGMVEVSQLLRHSSPAATAIYAKSDLTALSALARPWPAGATR